jgi:acetyl esterase/lipase
MNGGPSVTSIAYGTHPHQQMDVYSPATEAASAPVVFLIHGGGFIMGTKDDFTIPAGLMQGEGFVVVNLSHRLVDTTGIFRYPPLRRAASVRIADQLADVATAVKRYISEAPRLGTGTGRMYMAGHSAGAILAMLYVQGDLNADGQIRASGNWAGATDMSLPGNAAYNYLPQPQRTQLQELYHRAVGIEPTMEDHPAAMAISPYQVAQRGPGRPNISIYPEFNTVLHYPGEAAAGLRNTRAFHELLRSRGIDEELHVYAGSDHSFRMPADAWQRCTRQTSGFFRRH